LCRIKKKEDNENIEKIKRLYKMVILDDEECQIPNKHLYRFSSSDLGCQLLKFSPNGRFLAAAVTLRNSCTKIALFDVEDGTRSFELAGHKNLIHDMDWHNTSEFCLSSSSDLSCIVSVS
jgi:WD40 repeat protein